MRAAPGYPDPRAGLRDPGARIRAGVRDRRRCHLPDHRSGPAARRADRRGDADPGPRRAPAADPADGRGRRLHRGRRRGADGLPAAGAVGSAFISSSEIVGVLVAGGLICLVGVLDDRFDLDAITKLAGQILAAGVLVLFGVQWQVLWLPAAGRGRHPGRAWTRPRACWSPC